MGGQKHLVYVPQEKQDDAKAFHLEVRLIQYNAIGCKSNNLSYQMTAQTGVATSWRITQHRALFRQFVHDNVRNHQSPTTCTQFRIFGTLRRIFTMWLFNLNFDLSMFPHMSHLFSDRQGLGSKQTIHVVCRDVRYGFPSPSKCDILNHLQVYKHTCSNQTRSQGSTNGNLPFFEGIVSNICFHQVVPKSRHDPGS